jgi:hypothetical protein
MVQILRIQDSEGRGPWRPGFSQAWIVDRSDHENLMPWYVEMGRVDKFVTPGFYMGCGCLTSDQLRRWFTECEYRTLLGFGYLAVIMRGDIIAESEIQVVFQRHIPLRKKVVKFDLY